MPKIQCLDPHVADLIAAGEVVERPASVVKELVENAIDAGATSVTVEIRRGGMSYIRVTDNGSGIAPEDAETAFLRHATSKIHNQYDLEAIGTLGFRGEALAAISAVSKVELTTRREQDELGTALLLDGGVVRTRQETGCPVGTTMIVRELFYNTPARLKFMKRDVTEGAAVFAAVQHIAMSHPEVAFRFFREERQDLLTPGDGKLQSAVYAVLGRQMALGFLPCKGSGENGLTVEGFVSRPACCRGTRGYQHFFVNGRYVKSKTMMAALEEGYKNTKMVGRFPACVLHISTKLNLVDVNVHPAKTEVKFTDEKALFQLIHQAVRGALSGETGHPQVELKEPARPVDSVGAGLKKDNYFQTMTAEEFRKNGPAKSGTRLPLHDSGAAAYPPPRPTVVPPVHVVPKPFAPVRASEEFRDVDLPVLMERPARTAAFAKAMEQRRKEEDTPLMREKREKLQKEPAAPEKQKAGITPAVTEEKDPVPAQKAPIRSAQPEEERAAEKASAPVLQELEQQSILQDNAEPVAPQTPAWRMAGEVLDTYIIVEQGDRVLFIDKHAAHERMNFDRLKARDYQPMRQLLLTPIVVTPPPEEGAALLAQLPLLEQFGFEVEDFGKGALIVRQVPDYLSTGQVESTLAELAQRFLTTGTADPSAARDEVLHTMACKSAIKGGWKSDPEELRAVAEAVMSGQVKYCPHGRPVAIEMTRKQLEKQFKRT